MPPKDVEALLKTFPAAVRELAERTRAFVLAEFAGAIEQVKPGWHALWYGTSPKANDQILVIQPQSSYVNLAFAKGAMLHDPAGLLEGTGKSIRHVKIRDGADLERAELRDLVRAATKGK
jgi:hypothetical protein